MIVSKYSGVCPYCERYYDVGAELGRGEQGWGHWYCVEGLKSKAKINAGETYRGQRPSQWRRRSRRK